MRRLVFLIALLVACSGSDSPASFSAADLPDSPDLSAVVSSSLPDWVTYPEELPKGLRGRNNCAFSSGNVTAQWNYYGDGACWERPGPDGWTRQQNHHVHVDRSASCSNGPADVFNVRICRAPGEDTPCALSPRTGPNGCAICVSSVTCLQ